MSQSSLYRIRARGVVPEGWLRRLGSLRLTGDESGVVTLEGHLADQAALTGVLDTLVSLRLTILEVSMIEDQVVS